MIIILIFQKKDLFMIISKKTFLLASFALFSHAITQPAAQTQPAVQMDQAQAQKLLIDSALKNNLKGIETAIENGAQLNPTSTQTVLEAIATHPSVKVDTIAKLIEKGSKPNAWIISRILYAEDDGNRYEKVKLIAELTKDIDIKNVIQKTITKTTNNVQMLEEILQNQAIELDKVERDSIQKQLEKLKYTLYFLNKL